MISPRTPHLTRFEFRFCFNIASFSFSEFHELLNEHIAAKALSSIMAIKFDACLCGAQLDPRYVITMPINFVKPSVIAISLIALSLGACSGGELKVPRQKSTGEIGRKFESDKRATVFGPDGIDLGGSKSVANADQASGGGIGVNSYLWRATLDTVSFLPVTSADPFGGVIITDWYAPPETPNERFKLNVYVLGRALRADGVQVSVFRQLIDSVGNWRDAPVEADAGRKIEDSILTRARQLRNETRQMAN